MEIFSLAEQGLQVGSQAGCCYTWLGAEQQC